MTAKKKKRSQDYQWRAYQLDEDSADSLADAMLSVNESTTTSAKKKFVEVTVLGDVPEGELALRLARMAVLLMEEHLNNKPAMGFTAEDVKELAQLLGVPRRRACKALLNIAARYNRAA